MSMQRRQVRHRTDPRICLDSFEALRLDGTALGEGGGLSVGRGAEKGQVLEPQFLALLPVVGDAEELKDLQLARV